MDAVEFFKTVKRLCKNQGCDGCPVCKNNTCMVTLMARIHGASDESIEETISKVEQWGKAHPIKTRQSEFLKMFPNAATYEDDGILCIKPCVIDKSIGCANGKNCDDCRCKYWLAEVTDND